MIVMMNGDNESQKNTGSYSPRSTIKGRLQTRRLSAARKTRGLTCANCRAKKVCSYAANRLTTPVLLIVWGFFFSRCVATEASPVARPARSMPSIAAMIKRHQCRKS